jgi:mannose-1-phosphate guanylyltransferase
MKTIILAAGFGSRLWPLSTATRPKQFQNLIGTTSPLRYSYELLRRIVPTDELYVLTLAGLEPLVFEQLPGIASTNVIAVPERRNTLPHTLYALSCVGADATEPVLFTAVDHYHADDAALLDDLQDILQRLSTETTKTHLLCTPADDINKSLGYVIADASGAITEFIEKPTGPVAERLAALNTVRTNTMWYVTSKASIETLLAAADNTVSTAAKHLLASTPATRIDTFLAMPFIDISHGLFEKAPGLIAAPVRTPFRDVGTFGALYAINQKDEHGNVALGPVVFDDASRGNFVVNQLDQPLAIINTHDSVIVQTPDGSLTAPLEDADAVGELYKQRIYGAAA